MPARKTTAQRSTRCSSNRDQLEQRVREHLGNEIRFVYSSEFDTIGRSEKPVQEAELLMQRLRSDAREADAQREARSLPGDEAVHHRYWTAPDPLLTFEDEQVLFRAMNLLRFRANQLRAKLSVSKSTVRQLNKIDSLLDHADQIRGQLVRSNLRLVGSVARKFAMNEVDVDEFSSDGCLILMGAIDRFDYSRGFRFSTYATHSLQRHYYRACQVRSRQRQRFSNGILEILNEVPQLEVEPSLCDEPDAIVVELMNQAEDILDVREHRILMDRYGLNVKQPARTLREIAEDLGISKERVRQLQMKALDKLRGLLDPDRLNLEVVAAC
ncbi:MAG: sigma-70 family RNA polymerase sigma factor [Planctomycetaceae bacterium]